MVSLVTGLEGVMLITVDLCALGMIDEDERSHCRMMTIMTNDSVVADAFRPYRCAQDHSFATAGSRHSRRAQEHDRRFCEILTTALKASLLNRDRREPRQLMTLTVRNDEEREEDSGLEEEEQPAEYQLPTEMQIKMVNQYHRNLGHPSRREFLKVLKAAHAKPAVLEYVRREYRCADCDAHTKPQPSRKAAIPRTYEFNRIIALDVFYISLRGQSLPVLNIICHGTNFQVAALMRQDGTPTAAMVWSTFQRSWRRYFGTPDVMITDGGPEFRGDFAQSGEYAGILQVVVDADAPWQNGNCERHGGLVKDLLAKGLETEVVFTPDDLEDLLAEIVSLKNRRGNRGGFTPYQLVIGQNPRVPHELLSDDAVDEVGMQELNRDDADLDSPAKAFRQSMRIRDHARMLMETHTARERLRSAGKAQLHRDRNFHRGQWVYVWRRDLRGARDRTGGPSLSRWVGPGLVALQDGTTVWVSMRGRLWKCAREQIREATNHESLGAELLTHDHLRQLLTDARSPQTLTEAVDVSAEWAREEDRNQEHHPEAASMENDVIQQSADMPHSDQDNKAQENEVDRSLSESRLELTRMDQSTATESNRPMYPPPGLEDPNHVTEHAIVPVTTITNPQNISRRLIPGRRRTLSQTSTAAPLPLEDGSNRSLDLDTVSEGTDETGFSENKRPRTAEFTVTSLPGKEVLKPADSSETTPGVSSAISDAAIESVNRNRMLDFGKTTCRRIHPEPVIEREHSQSSEEHSAALLVGTWYYLTPDSSGALVSEVVDRKDLALERTHPPGHHFTPTGPTGGHNNESDCATDDNVFLARSSDEVYPKHLSLDDRIAFEIADAAEWKAIVDTGSVKVLNSEVANTIRKKQPDRVINCRMVRRLKPQEGTFQKPKAKSRWCVLGHQDPDAADMFTYAPTPQTESIMMFLFLMQLCDLALSIADLKNAFCHSDSLDRSAGPLFVEPCEGLDLPPGSLIQLVAPVYGLNDAPLRWHRTLTTWLIKQGYRKSLLEPCLYVHYAPGGSVDGLILIEVDDLAIGIKRMQEAEFQQRFQTAFRFGKWEKRKASYAGRRIRQRDQYVLVDQEKYILEKLHPVLLREKQQKDRKLSLDEFNQLRSLVYKISWVAKESRPEASGSASIVAQHLKAPTVSDVLIANRVVKFLRSSASQCLTIWRHDPRNLRVISVSDAGGIGGPPTENGENVQNAHLIMIADDGIRQGVHSKATTLMWRSARCKRAVNSTLAGETIAMSAALADAEWAQIMIQDVLNQTVTRDTTGGTLLYSLQAFASRTFDRREISFRCPDQGVRGKSSGSTYSCGPRNR